MSSNNYNVPQSFSQKEVLLTIGEQLSKELDQADLETVEPLKEAINAIREVGALLDDLENKGKYQLDTLHRLDGTITELEFALKDIALSYFLKGTQKSPATSSIRQCEELHQSVRDQIAIAGLEELLADPEYIQAMELGKRASQLHSILRLPESSLKPEYLELGRELIKAVPVSKRDHVVQSLKGFFEVFPKQEPVCLPVLAKILLPDRELQSLYSHFDRYQVMWLDSTDEQEWAKFDAEVLGGQILVEIIQDPGLFQQDKRERFLSFVGGAARDRPAILRAMASTASRLGPLLEGVRPNVFLDVNQELADGNVQGAPVLFAPVLQSPHFWKEAVMNSETLTSIARVLQHSPIRAADLPKEAFQSLVTFQQQALGSDWLARWLDLSAGEMELETFASLPEVQRAEAYNTGERLADLLIDIFHKDNPHQDPVCKKATEFIINAPKTEQEKLCQMVSQWLVSGTVSPAVIATILGLVAGSEDGEKGAAFMDSLLEKMGWGPLEDALFWQTLDAQIETNEEGVRRVIQYLITATPSLPPAALARMTPRCFQMMTSMELTLECYQNLWAVALSLSPENKKIFPHFFEQSNRQVITEYLDVLSKLPKGPVSTQSLFYAGALWEKLFSITEMLVDEGVPGCSVGAEGVRAIGVERARILATCDNIVDRIREVSLEPVQKARRAKLKSILEDGIRELGVRKHELIALLGHVAIDRGEPSLLFMMWDLDLPRIHQVGTSKTAESARKVFAHVLLDKTPGLLVFNSGDQHHSALHLSEAIQQLLNSGKLQDSFGEGFPAVKLLKDEILPLFEDSLPRAYDLAALGVTYLPQLFQQKIQQLPVGESLYLPLAFACRAVDGRHTIGWRIHRSSEKEVRFVVYNTGYGLDDFHYQSEEDGDYYQTWLEVTDIPFEDAGEKMWERLGPLLSNPQATIEDFYEFILKQGVRSECSLYWEVDYQKQQVSGTCATLSSLAMIRHMVTEQLDEEGWYREDWKSAWHLIKQGLKEELWKSFQRHIPVDVSIVALSHLNKARAFTSKKLLQALTTEEGFLEEVSRLKKISSSFPNDTPNEAEALIAEIDPKAVPSNCMARYGVIKTLVKALANTYLGLEAPSHKLSQAIEENELVLPYVQASQTQVYEKLLKLKIHLKTQNPESHVTARYLRELHDMKGGAPLLIELMAKWINTRTEIVEKIGGELETFLDYFELEELAQIADRDLEAELAEAVKQCWSREYDWEYYNENDNDFEEWDYYE